MEGALSTIPRPGIGSGGAGGRSRLSGRGISAARHRLPRTSVPDDLRSPQGYMYVTY